MAKKVAKKTIAKKKVAKAAPKKLPAKKSTVKKAAAPRAPAATRKTVTRKSAKAAKAVAPSRPIKVTAIAGKTITASALLQAVADHTEMSRTEAKRFIESYLDVVKAHVLKGVKVKIGDIGMIMIRARKARMGRNPATGEPVKIKASKKLAFRQSATMREAVR
ncbi:MAG: HU family DNA-binding protein [Hyphomonadaceae bacterium]|nr:MAG: DNA-binding protein HU-beta [Caulobacteraceae bacterium]MBT9444485.1 HU family DNA-binding protein [Hyphomonadaceae bacterium]TPW02911.1 MAG: DNA-binding protein HU-beta [Alphaproteobacteria bacterium]